MFDIIAPPADSREDSRKTVPTASIQHPYSARVARPLKQAYCRRGASTCPQNPLPRRFNRRRQRGQRQGKVSPIVCSVSGTPGTPGALGTPDTPDTPDASDAFDGSGTSDVPDMLNSSPQEGHLPGKCFSFGRGGNVRFCGLGFIFRSPALPRSALRASSGRSDRGSSTFSSGTQHESPSPATSVVHDRRPCRSRELSSSGV